MRVRDVDAHSAGAGRTHFHVDAYGRVFERTMKEEDVPRDLRHALHDEQFFDRGDERLQLAALDGIGARRDGIEHRLHFARRLELVEIADGRGGVDAVDDDVGSMRVDQLKERRLGVVGIAREDLVEQLNVSVGVGDDVAAIDSLQRLRQKDVACRACEFNAAHFLAKKRNDIVDFILLQ